MISTKFRQIVPVFIISISVIFFMFACKPQAQTLAAATKGTSVAPGQTKQPSKKPVRTLTPILVSPTAELSPTVETKQPAIQVDLERLRGLKISFWHPWMDMTAYQVENLVEQFNLTNEWGIEVEVISTGGSSALYSQVAGALQLGLVQPVVIAAPIEALTGWQKDYEAVIDLKEYIYDPVYGLSDKEIADFTYVFWRQDSVGEVQFGIPATRTVQVLFYNQSLAQELGFMKAPVTTEAFKEQVCAAAQANMADETRSNDGMGGWLVDTSPLVTLSWINSFGEAALPSDESQDYRFNTEAGQDAFAFIKEMIDEGCAWVGRSPEPYSYFAERQALFFSGILEEVDSVDGAMIQSENEDTWTILPYPNNTNDKPVVIASGPSYAMMSGTPEENLAGWFLIRYLASAENQIKLVQVNYSLPVRVQVFQSLEVFARYHPQWALAQSWMPVIQPAPGLASWRTSRNILEDAVWQVVQPQTKADDLVLIMQELDATIEEVLNEQGR